ncbi:hypothetical protein VB773_05280 [Haloarculaceae archaeon H-GB2-1]|nr:hypothetical protein [Haloarculaceae archaeon H-GB1-1]MEA5388989.1 hypothetical protein [Haloarculaceae archaeon H-GB11]MEA5407047.1 hypothetical protein [Haloarculaceae archaeon H-GB2-1]
MATPEYGETWVYESIIGAVPGVNVPTWLALALQFGLFEAGVIVLSLIYDLSAGIVAGTVAVTVATAGSVAMLRISRLVRDANAPESYRHLLFGSSVEVVLGVVSFVGIVTYLFAFDATEPTLVTQLLGPEPPVLATYLTLLVLWDLCYRIGTGWWASVTGLWRSVRCDLDATAARRLRRADLETMAFGLLQLALVPFVIAHPLLLVAIVGHVVAVVTVTALSLAVLRRRAGSGGGLTTSSP